MKRALALVSFAFLAAGCDVRVVNGPGDPNGSGDPCQDPGTITVYWRFLRHTDTAILTYDCVQAGVSTVELWIGNEWVFTGDCRDARGVEGITVTNFEFASTYPATLFGLDAAGQVLFKVQNAAVDTEACNDVNVPARAGNLVLEPMLGTPNACSTGQSFVDYTLADGNGTVVSSASVDCASALSQGLLLANLDLGSYTLTSIEEFDAPSSTIPVVAACNLPVDHFLAGEAVPVTLASGVVCQ